jgi:hypothetical protein
MYKTGSLRYTMRLYRALEKIEPPSYTYVVKNHLVEVIELKESWDEYI